jgi:hypothetical protein
MTIETVAGIADIPVREARRRTPAAAPLPASLLEFAPRLLVCPVCDTLRLARADRTLLWHQVRREGVDYECPAVGLPGLYPEEVTAR